MDIDVNAAGAGLPDGSGTYAQGAAIYSQKCALCHGPKGEGIATFPRLIGIEHRQDFAFADDPKVPKTIGNYWPYATTLYDYIHRAMPFSAPGSLRPAEVYSLVAFLLSENEIVPRNAVINREALPKVVMPGRSHFKPDDRRGGSSFR
jgi:cytochrome c